MRNATAIIVFSKKNSDIKGWKEDPYHSHRPLLGFLEPPPVYSANQPRHLRNPRRLLSNSANWQTQVFFKQHRKSMLHQPQQWRNTGGDGPVRCHRWPDVCCVWTLWRVEILLYNGYTANGLLWYSVSLMLGHRLRRWPNIKTTLHLHRVFFCVRDARDVWRRDAINKAWTTRFTNELPTTPLAEPNLNSTQKKHDVTIDSLNKITEVQAIPPYREIDCLQSCFKKFSHYFMNIYFLPYIDEITHQDLTKRLSEQSPCITISYCFNWSIKYA